MQSGESKVAEKIALVRAADEQGSLASHSVAKVIGAADAQTPSSWGPAMRR